MTSLSSENHSPTYSNNPNNHIFYEGPYANKERERIIKEGNIGDTVSYLTNNQMGVRTYIIILNEDNNRDLKEIGDIYGLYDDPDHPDYIGGKKSIAKKYIPDKLSKKDKKKQKSQINKSRKMYKKKKYFTRKKVSSFKSKKSKHIIKSEKLYKTNIIPSKKLSKATGCSVNALNKIVKKGQGAYYSSGSRPNQSSHSWGYARLGSSISGGKAAAVDFKIIEKGCKKSGKAYKLALKSKKKNKFGTRKVPKYKQ